MSRKVLFAMLVSLDGYIEDKNGKLNWSEPDEELHRHFNELEKEIDIHLYGRRLYEIMNGYWPSADQNPDAHDYEIEYAKRWQKVPNVVFSKSLKEVDGNSRLVKENIKEEVEKLKSEPGSCMDLGGADIANTFMELDLIDEYRLYIHPVILGGGKPMFKELQTRKNLELIGTETFGSGVVMLRYTPKSEAEDRQ